LLNSRLSTPPFLNRQVPARRIFGSWFPLFSSEIIGIYCLLDWYTIKKRLATFPSPAGMSLIKLPLGEIIIIIIKLFHARESFVSDIPGFYSRLGAGMTLTFRTVYSMCYDQAALSLQNKVGNSISSTLKSNKSKIPGYKVLYKLLSLFFGQLL
jgi:hypothetical protein